jgi:hypothetical protein
VLSRWPGLLAATVVTLVTGTLVILDLSDAQERRWWDGHAITTDTMSGLLVLLITVLVVDQVVSRRQFNDRARAIAAQAAIVATQARRTAQAVSAAVFPGDDQGDRDAAVDEFRTYMMMLLVAAPVLIDAKVSRDFLEQAQALGGELARALAAQPPGATPASPGRLNDAAQRLREASAPLLQVLDPETRAAVRGDPTALSARTADPVMTGRYTKDFGETARNWSH